MNNSSQISTPQPELRLANVALDVWVASHPLAFFGLQMVACMTVVRLASGRLWVHSPIPLQGELKADLDAIGPVEYIVAPNRMHHLYALACLREYPSAHLYVAKNLASKNADFASFPIIPQGSAAPWSEALDSVFVEGNKELNETVFFHRSSRTLIFTDLAVYLGPWNAFATRIYARVNGCYNRLGLTFLLKMLFRDKETARRSIHQILEWDFQRIVLAHGPVIETDPRSAFEKAFSWLH